MNRDREAPIVAELGRPETPEETAARKAEASRLRRDRKTTQNLLLALAASLGVVLVIILMVPRGSAPDRPSIDFRAEAAAADGTLGAPVLAPAVPAGWTANVAELRRSTDGVASWNIGFITPDNRYLGFVEAVDANDTWVLQTLEGAAPTSGETRPLGGLDWLVYTAAESSEGNVRAGLVAVDDDVTLAVYGTATDAEMDVLATAAAAEYLAAVQEES